MKVGRLRRKLAASRKGPYSPMSCIVCGQPFGPDRKNANTCSTPTCRAQRKRDLANGLTTGRPTLGTDTRECVVCGDQFAGHKNAIACSRGCRLARLRELSRRRLGVGRYWCVVCGVELADLGEDGRERYTCSPECKRRAALNKNRRTYAAHPEYRQKMIETRRHKKETDPDYAARCRQWDVDRARRRIESDIRILATELEKRSGQNDSRQT